MPLEITAGGLVLEAIFSKTVWDFLQDKNSSDNQLKKCADEAFFIETYNRTETRKLLSQKNISRILRKIDPYLIAFYEQRF